MPVFLKLLLALIALPFAGWWWFQANTLITAWLLGHNEAFQRFVIWMISTLQSSGYVTLIVLGAAYLLVSLIELLLWPTSALSRRIGATALVFWLAVVGIETAAIFNGYSVNYAGMFAIDGMPPPEWGRRLSGIPLALLFAIGPEAMARWALLAFGAWWRQRSAARLMAGER